MDLLSWARSPWGESVLIHISWSLFWASLVGGVLFFLAHGGYMLFSQHHKRDPGEVDRLESQLKGLPARIPRHNGVARIFHWIMAFSMLVLVFTAFLPIVGVKFAWVQWHWMAGLAADGVDSLPRDSRQRSSWTSGRSGSDPATFQK